LKAGFEPATALFVSAELNPPQQEAVANVSGPLLVFAGAGSGKTRVITYRIANLVASERIAPYRILAVTFTNKAAGEMRSRLEGMVGPHVARDLWVGTFHATCAKILRRYPEAAGLNKNFVIYDSSDQKALVTRALRDLDLDEKRYAPRVVLGRIHKEKQEARGPEDMSLDSYMDDAIKKVYVKYEAGLRAANAVDFEDLILRVVRIVEADDRAAPEVKEARDALLRKFDFVLVDEFQDTNATQYRLLKALASRTRNLCVVGDDDQSIYKWRGADIRNIRGFKKDYPDAQVVKLEQNYRSTARIVSAALGVIAPSRDREPKELWTENEDGSPIQVVTTSDERDEAAHVVRGIMEARDVGIDPREIAVFYRVHAQSRVIEEALRGANIAYQIVGGMKFYERAEVKDALAYLRVLTNPKSDVDLLRVINVPARGIGKTTIERIASYASANGISVMEAMGRLDDIADVAGAARKRVGQVRELFLALSEAAVSAPPADVLKAVLGKTGYRASLEATDDAESEARLENLAELEGSMVDYAIEAEARGETPTLNGFLERVSLQSDLDGMVDAERVTLMTVHSAKGLEFEAVFLTGMEEDMFPYRGMDPARNDDTDEERRLAYVAVTRARKHLILSYARARQIFGNTRLGVPSRFIGDFPPDAYTQVATNAAKALDSMRYVDRMPSYRPPSARPTSSGGWRHPQSRPVNEAPAREAGERYVEHDFSDDNYSEDVPIRLGMRVMHERFGRGEVRKVLTLGEPAVLAFFPGWGEMKVLARFLKLG